MLLLVESSRWCCRHLGPDSTQRAENPAPSLWPRASRPAPVERASPRRGVPMRVGPSSDGRQARSPRWTGGQPAPWSPARHLLVAFLFSPLGREVLVAQGEQGAHVFSFRFAHVQPLRARFDGLRKTDINHQFIIFACTPWSSQHPTMTSGSRMGPSTAPPGAAPCAPAQSTAGAPPAAATQPRGRGAALNSRYNQ
jgi:hypothetical protein